MRNDARIRKADYEEITRLNDRLKRVIPIIPSVFGTAGVTFGSGLGDGGGGFGFPGFFGFGPFGGLPGGPGGGGPITSPFPVPIAFPGRRDVRVQEPIPVQQPVNAPVGTGAGQGTGVGVPTEPGVQPELIPGTTEEEEGEEQKPRPPFEFPPIPNPIPYIIPLIKPLFEPVVASAQYLTSGQFMVDMARGVMGEEGYKKLETEFAELPDQLAAQQEQQQNAGLLKNLTDPNFIMQSIALQQTLGGLGRPGTDTFGDLAVQANLATRLSRAFKFKGQSTPFATPLPKDYFLRGQTSILKGDYFSSNPLMRKKLEKVFQDPSFDDFPQLPGTAFGTEPLFPTNIKTSGQRKTSIVDPTVVDDVPQNLKGVGGKHSRGTGVTEEVVTTTGESTKVKEFKDVYEQLEPDVLESLQQQYRTTTSPTTRKEIQEIFDAQLDANRLDDILPPPPNKDLGLQSSTRTLIKPIYIIS